MIGGGIATLSVPEGFRYLDPSQAKKVLVAWGNPPGKMTLGMLFPTDIGPFEESGWGVVISYDDDVYVADNDADSVDYADLLKQMKEEVISGNEERETQGYEPIELIGWASPPRYNRATHKLYWARELKFGDQVENTLNYDIRVLGRKGVLSFNAVASMNQLATIQEQMQRFSASLNSTRATSIRNSTRPSISLRRMGSGLLLPERLQPKSACSSFCWVACWR